MNIAEMVENVAHLPSVKIQATLNNNNDTTETQKQPQCPEEERFRIKSTWKRWLILLLFMLNSANKAYQWIQLPSSTQKLTYYYDVDSYVINSLSTIFMIIYVFLTYPACFVIEAIGLRRAVLFGSAATSLGSLIKCFSCDHHYGIHLLFLGQITIGLGEQLIFSVPSRLASIWFPDHQVGTALSLTLFGNQLGIALGFLHTQYMLNEAVSKEEIGTAFHTIYVYLLLISAANTLACLVFFDEAPKNVPGRARLKQLRQELHKKAGRKFDFRAELSSLFFQMRDIVKKGNFRLLAGSYAINIGLSYVVATLLNQMLELDWPGDDLFVGLVGFLIIITGVVGSLFWGPLLDRNHKYLLTNLVMTFLALISLGLFGYAMCFHKSQTGVFLAAALYGVFQTGFYVAGLDLAVELTYPTPELVSSSLMNLCPQVFATFAIYAGSFILNNYGLLALFGFYCFFTMLALLLLLNVKEVLLRQEAVKLQKKLSLKDKLARQLQLEEVRTTI